MNDTDAESDLRANRRSPHRKRQSAQHADLRLPERRPKYNIKKLKNKTKRKKNTKIKTRKG